jgi:hypothetical protein
MQLDAIEQQPVEEPLAELERQLIHAYLAGAGYTFHDLMTRNDRAPIVGGCVAVRE